MISFLFLRINFIQPLFNSITEKYVIGFSLIICFAITYRVLNHLPILDFRAYKIGDNLMENMTIPDDAPKDLYEYNWEFIDGDEKKTIVTNGEYPNVSWEFVKVETELLEKGYEPSIYDFTIEVNNEDLTDEILNEEKLVIYISYNLDKFSISSIQDMIDSAEKAKELGYKIIGLTASSIEQRDLFLKANNIFFNFYTCDETALKTIVRSNPGAIVLNKGTVVDKKHHKDFSDLNFR
jgi:hypothetical protein